MEKRCQNYVLTAPYPSVSDIKPDARIARRLLAEYASGEGELAAITQYFYNSLIVPLTGPAALGDLFSCVSRVEMHHLELIGKLIIAYGGDPGFLSYGRGDRTAWWTGAYVNYEKDPVKILKNAIHAEQAAIADYRTTISYLNNDSVRDLISRIIADEEHHIALFTTAMNALR